MFLGPKFNPAEDQVDYSQREEPPYQAVVDDSADEDPSEEVKTFVAEEVEYLKTLPEIKEACVENERLRASQIRSRKEFLLARDSELTSLVAFFGDV